MNRNRSRRRRNRAPAGFTLMEVLLVLAILVILGSLTFFAFGDVLFGAKRKTAKIQIDGLKTPMQTFLLEENRYPQTLEELWTPSQKTGRKYADPLGLDPWGNQYQYEPPTDSSAGAQYKISSNGPDGQAGTGDDVSNLTVEQ
jgi:general secretion pathway protein G